MKKENLLKITDLRHELHMYPELSMQEKETERVPGGDHIHRQRGGLSSTAYCRIRF